MTDSGAQAPKVFVSYSWDSEEHRQWVRNFAARLREDGVDAKLDQWELRYGDPLPEFMERSVRENDFVLVICTPNYKERSDDRTGGVGYEGSIMTAEVLSTKNHRKFKPILRCGDWTNAFPSWLSGKQGADLRGDSYSEGLYKSLVGELHGQAPEAPPLGSAPPSVTTKPIEQDPSVTDSSDSSDHLADSSVDPDKLEGARQQLQDLPVEAVPERHSGLPSGSVMRLRPNPHFVGRREDLKQIAASLKDAGTTAIGGVTVAASSGLGGVGKTQLACEFVYRYGRFFHGVYWINFGDPAGIPAEIASCGDVEGMNFRPYDYRDLSMRERVQAVIAEWEDDLPRLLVFDNCEDEELLNRWLPSTGGCRVLVTSRRESWDPSLGVMNLKLGVLDRQESVALLREYRPDLPADSRELDAIAEELGDLPLALDLAGRYLDKYRREVTPAEYLTKIQRPEILEHPSLRGASGLSPTKHEMDIWRTFAVSYGWLDAEDETDRTSLKLLARAARLAVGEPIPDKLLVWTLGVPGVDGGSAEASTTIRDALDRLTDLGLMERLDEAYVSMHRLVATFALAEISDDEAQAAVERACERASARAHIEGLPVEVVVLLPHLRLVTDNMAGDRVDDMAIDLCTIVGESLKQIGAYDEAMRYADRAWAISAELYGLEGRITLQRRSNVGELLETKGDRPQARSIYEEVLEAQERCYGSDDPDVAATLNNLGASFAREDLYHETLSAYSRALRIREAVWEETTPDDPDRQENAYELAQSRRNMGDLLMDLGRYEEAEPLFKGAVEILADEVGPDHEQNADTLVVLGRALRAQRSPEALLSLDSALTVYMNIGMPYSSGAAWALANYGVVAKQWAEEDQTLSASQRDDLLQRANNTLHAALEGAEAMYGEGDPRTGGILRVLSAVCQAQGYAADDHEYRERAETNRRANLEPVDVEAADILDTHGANLVQYGIYEEAQAYMEHTLPLRESTFGEEDFNTSVSLLKLGVLMQLQGYENEARKYFERTLNIRANLCGEGHAATDLVRENLRLLNG